MLRWAPYAFLAVTVLWVTEHAWGALDDPDSWWHLRLGEDLLHQHSLATPAHWSTFATSPWVPTQPLPELASALVNRGLGLEGLVWMYVATVVVLVIGVFMLDRVYAAPLPAVVATMLFVAAGESAMTPRPQLISYGLLAVVLATWLRTASGSSGSPMACSRSPPSSSAAARRPASSSGSHSCRPPRPSSSC